MQIAPLDLSELSHAELIEKIAGLLQENDALRNELAATLKITFYDKLTDLPNRHGYDRYVNALQALSRTPEFKAVQEGGRTGGLLVAQIDIDHFKDINTMLTHFGGDMVLELFSQRLAGCVRVNSVQSQLTGVSLLRSPASLMVEEYLVRNGIPGTDLISRWGGEEFFCLFPLCYKDQNAAKTAYDDADNIIQRLMNSIRNQPFTIPINPATYDEINKTTLGKSKQYYHDAKLIDDKHGKRVILPISASIGYAVIGWDELMHNTKEDTAHLFRNVVDLMRRAKTGGRNRAVTVRASAHDHKPAIQVQEGKALYKMNTADIVQEH